MLFILLSAMLYALFIKPWYSTALIKYEHIDDLKEVFTQGGELQAVRDELQDEFNDIHEIKKDLVRTAIPKYSPGNIILFLLALEDLLGKSGLPLDTNYGVGGEKTEAEKIVLPVSFSFGEISYRSLRNFIGNLQQWERGVRIRSVQISAPVNSDAAQRGVVRATIVIEALFLSASNTV